MNKIHFASDTVASALQPYIDEILANIDNLLDRKPRKAWVSDESLLSFFLPYELTGEVDERGSKIATHETPKNRQLITDLAKRLEVSVSLDDYVYEIAIRLRDK